MILLFCYASSNGTSWDGHRKPKQRANARLRGIENGDGGGPGGEGSQSSMGGMDAGDKGARSLLQAYNRDGVNRIEASLGIGKNSSHDQNEGGGGGLNPLRIPSIGRMGGQNNQMAIGNSGVSPRGGGGGGGSQIGKENTGRRRNNRQGNNRGRHKKYSAGNHHADGGFENNMLGHSMGGAGGSIIHTGGAGAGNSIVQGSNSGGDGGNNV